MRRSLLPHLGFYIEQGGGRLQGGFKWLANASQTTKDYLRPLASLVAFCARAFFALLQNMELTLRSGEKINNRLSVAAIEAAIRSIDSAAVSRGNKKDKLALLKSMVVENTLYW